jgi:hypothetical protein
LLRLDVNVGEPIDDVNIKKHKKTLHTSY